jgi:hypothetical protein
VINKSISKYPEVNVRPFKKLLNLFTNGGTITGRNLSTQEE